MSNHSPKACEKLVHLSNCLSLSPQRSPRFQPETVKPAIDALYRAQLRAILRGGRAETTEGSGPLAMSANRTAIFLEFAILVVEVWRNGKNDAAAMPADLGWIVCARAHAIPEFHPTDTQQPRRRGPASKIRDRFSESIFGRGTRRFPCKACARQRKDYACMQADMSRRLSADTAKHNHRLAIARPTKATCTVYMAFCG